MPFICQTCAADFAPFAAAVSIAALGGCVTAPPRRRRRRPPVAAAAARRHPMTAPRNPTSCACPIWPDKAPVRVGVLLPFSNGSAGTRALAAAMLKAAQLALFDTGNPDIMLMTADEGSTPEAAAGARIAAGQGRGNHRRPALSPHR